MRVIAVGPHTVDLEVFAYVTTDDYDEFLADREDLYLRMIEAVEQASTSFAPPASITYVARDPGMDEQRTRNAETQVEEWRRESALPFPEFSPQQRENLAGTLVYPPAGSARPSRGGRRHPRRPGVARPA